MAKRHGALAPPPLAVDKRNPKDICGYGGEKATTPGALMAGGRERARHGTDKNHEREGRASVPARRRSSKIREWLLIRFFIYKLGKLQQIHIPNFVVFFIVYLKFNS